MNISFEGKRILVTGAGQGIGRALALRLSKFGGKVIALEQSQFHLDTLSHEDSSIEIVRADLNDWNATRDILQKSLPIDLLVNNAGVIKLQSFLEVQPEDIDVAFNVNVKAIINVSQIAAKSMIDTGKGGSIVNISSQGSQAALTDHTVYCSTKGAVDQLTSDEAIVKSTMNVISPVLLQSMALELGPHNIRVNAVNPTVVMTNIGRIAWSDPEKSANMLSKIPLGRFAEVNEVVDGVVYLLSNHSSMIHGVTLPIDGGFLAT